MPDISDHSPYSDGIDPDSAHFPGDNYPVMPYSTSIFKKPITDQ